MLSVIIPAYNEEKMITKTARAISAALDREEIPYELLFVNDGSSDLTWEEIETAARNNRRIRGVCLSRNFGKESAIFAGLSKSRGNCCAVIDCDLQHPPEALVEMYRLWQQGYKVVEGVKRSRGKESLLHTLFVRGFYFLISRACRFDLSKSSDFKLLDREAVDALLIMPERNVFFRALSSWIGFKSICVEFDVQERADGHSKWSSWSLVKYALSGIASFSAAPMQLVTIVGGLFLLFSVALGAHSLYMRLSGRALEGFTTVIILLLMTGSIIMISLGIIGYYIAKIYDEIKGRPRFIISREAEGMQDGEEGRHD